MMVKMKAPKDPMDSKAAAKKRDASQTRATLAGEVMQQAIELPNGMWERISAKAYELWEQRGCREGHDLQDWFDAEGIVMDEIHEARE
ncbi:MAG: DUF2934 domain-containing protein [Nitrospira sp.]|nr:DUF2934 domain-containing protein [Nitrospira sp.]